MKSLVYRISITNKLFWALTLLLAVGVCTTLSAFAFSSAKMRTSGRVGMIRKKPGCMHCLSLFGYFKFNHTATTVIVATWFWDRYPQRWCKMGTFLTTFGGQEWFFARIHIYMIIGHNICRSHINFINTYILHIYWYVVYLEICHNYLPLSHWLTKS